MRLRCAGCGVKERVRLRTFLELWPGPTWLHLECFEDYLAQRRLDGLDFEEPEA